VHQLLIVFKKAYDSVRRKVLYNILIEFFIPINLISLIKVCLTETYSRIQVGTNLSDILGFFKKFRTLFLTLFIKNFKSKLHHFST